MKQILWPALLLPVLLFAASTFQPSQQGRPGRGQGPRTRPPRPSLDWPQYGADPGGTRYSARRQINRGNVSRLERAWTYRSGDFSDGSGAIDATMFEATPVFFEERLYLITPFNRVVALDPTTGAEVWSFDPQIDRTVPNTFAARGVATWSDPRVRAGACHTRILFGTLDARLIALDAEGGLPCPDFGTNGQVDLTAGLGSVERRDYFVTSPPAVVNDLVIIGSSIGDNRRIEVESGVVRAFDVRSGQLRWSWDPIPRTPGSPGWEAWESEAALRTGAANAWAPLAADPSRDLVFIPTGSAAPDHYGGERRGTNLFADCVVALRASTGQIVWHFQVVHHDVWDYDVPAQPLLSSISREGQDIPAVVVNTKMGHVFVLDRESGQPLFPVEERPVPAAAVPGEMLSATQPFPVLPPPLHPGLPAPQDAFGLTPQDQEFCRQQLENFDYQGIFTAPSLTGSIIFPGLAGGTNWGSAAVEVEQRVMVVNISRFPVWVRLIPRAQFADEAAQGDPSVEFAPQLGTPYGMARAAVLSPGGIPCNPPPWGETIAVDLETGQIRWRVPTGVYPALLGFEEASNWGSVVLGGPMVTAGGLVFVSGDQSETLRALDIDSGAELWRDDLPAGGVATPMTYLAAANGKQYVVIAAGGHRGLRTRLGDFVIAYSLP